MERASRCEQDDGLEDIRKAQSKAGIEIVIKMLARKDLCDCGRESLMPSPTLLSGRRAVHFVSGIPMLADHTFFFDGRMS